MADRRVMMVIMIIITKTRRAKSRMQLKRDQEMTVVCTVVAVCVRRGPGGGHRGRGQYGSVGVWSKRLGESPSLRPLTQSHLNTCHLGPVVRTVSGLDIRGQGVV